MKESVIKKLKEIVEQYHSIGNQLLDVEIQKNNALTIELSKERSHLEPIVKLFENNNNSLKKRKTPLKLLMKETKN